MKTICLNMIVKNEAHVIINTFNNILNSIKLDYWVISDTGSTDNTQNIIINYFKEKNIPGELVHHEWKDFGYNRTKALEAAFNKSDYLLIFDADDSFHGNFVLPNLTADSYHLQFGKHFTYLRPQLVNNRKRWEYKGVLHEFIVCKDPTKPHEVILGDYYIDSGKTGDRSKDPDKYLKDALILSKAFENEKDQGMKCRYAFYCAQSYKDYNKPLEAIEWYKKCLKDNWNQEKYFSCLMIAEQNLKINNPTESLKYWIKSSEYDSERIDGIVDACDYLRNNDMHLLVNLLYHKYKNYNRYPKEKLFLYQDKYFNLLEFNNSISAFYANDPKSGYECCKKIIIDNVSPLHYINLTFSNIQCYDIPIDDELFQAVDRYIKNNNQINPECFKVWEKTINYQELIKFSKKQPKNKSKPKILISFTTCKRFDLFKQTINSILNTWTDVDLIDYWFCVDDNSSNEDRKMMKNFYKWIDFYNKTPEEKGHRISMNIIWDKLNKLKPDYWIHMEDDFLFHDKMDYISTSIKYLNELESQNIHQILFNRNYAETISDYKIIGHIPYNDDIVFHEHKQGNFPYPNCHYWPHYSFRPSMTRTDTILNLGNYDSPNQFFEMDYANKWNENGYKSAFFNKITCKHIGKLTSEKDKPNAYTLNNEGQFSKIINNIKVVNLERRIDRKEQVIEKFKKANIFDYEFVNAVDGKELIPSIYVRNLFNGNDFGNRKAVIGCALSHYNLWTELLNNQNVEYYFIMEDDFSICDNFKNIIKKLEKENIFKDSELLLMGYHMYSTQREKVKDIYDSNNYSNIKIENLNKKLFIGATHCYSINKIGAKKLCYYIKENGIKHGIDYLFKIVNDLIPKETQPLIAFADWNENGKMIDSDIQNDKDSFDFSITKEDLLQKYDCYKNQDFFGSDIKKINSDNLFDQLIIAEYTNDCDGFNSFGYFKKSVNVDNLISLENCDLYVKKKEKKIILSEMNIRDHFTFIALKDHIGDDLYRLNEPIEDLMVRAIQDKNCIAFNTLGFFKSKIGELSNSPYFSEKDGIYIKSAYYESHTIEKIYNDDKKIMNSIFIETGAYIGGGIEAALRLGFDEIHSIELAEKYYNICKEKFKDNPKVNVHLGDSGVILKELLKKINKGVTFWLDGHYSSCDTACAQDYVSPIQQELDSIKKYYNDDHVVLIDDMKDFNEESINWNNQVNKKCGYITKKVLEEKLNNIFGNALTYYPGPACVSYKKEIKWYYFYTKDYEFYNNHLRNNNIFHMFPILIDDFELNTNGHHFNNITIKIELVIKSIKENWNKYILFTDATLMTTRLNELFQYLLTLTKRDIYFADNAIDNTVNIGFMLINCNQKTLKFWEDVLHLMKNKTCNWDQQAVNLLVGNIDYELFDKSRIHCGYDFNNEYRNTYYVFKSFIINKNDKNINFKSRLDLFLKNNMISMEEYNKWINSKKVKLLCNWDKSENICKEWQKFNNTDIIFTNENPDYYVIINKPDFNEYYDEKKTIIFQMEPWVHDESKKWGVKTWGVWAEPDESKFLCVYRKKNLFVNSLNGNVPQNKINKIVSICSSKNQDTGHILRNNFIKKLEEINVNISYFENMLKQCNNDNNNLIKYIVNPLMGYYICDLFLGDDWKEIPGIKPDAQDILKNGSLKIKENDILYVQVNYFEYFCMNILPIIDKKFILITGQFHNPQIFPSKLTSIVLDNPYLIKWFSQNPVFEHPKYEGFPYGIFQQFLPKYYNALLKNNEKITKINNLFVTKENNPEINIIPDVPKENLDEYYKKLSQSEFILSPAGDRAECYRHWEAIGLKTIPIANVPKTYKQLFKNNMEYVNSVKEMVDLLENNNLIYNKPNTDIISVEYWKNKINNCKTNQKIIDVYGRDNYHNFQSYVGMLTDDNRFNGYSKYKYCFSAENNAENDYATEKIYEPIFCECLCFYWGCPNLEEFLNPLVFVRLDLNDVEGSIALVKKAIEEDWWSQRIDIIRQEKNKIINDLGFFHKLKKIIDQNSSSPLK